MAIASCIHIVESCTSHHETEKLGYWPTNAMHRANNKVKKEYAKSTRFEPCRIVCWSWIKPAYHILPHPQI